MTRHHSGFYDRLVEIPALPNEKASLDVTEAFQNKLYKDYNGASCHLPWQHGMKLQM